MNVESNLQLDLLAKLKQANIEVLPAAPGSPQQGQLYFDSVLVGLFVYDGTAWVNLGNIFGTQLLDPTGFESPADVTITYDSGTRKITVAQTGGIVIWWRGVRRVISTPQVSDAHDAGASTYFLTYNNGVFAWSTSPWAFSDIMVAYVNNAASLGTPLALRECHGANLPWPAHQNEHYNVGTYRKSGGALTGGTYAIQPATPADADNTPGVDSAEIWDEDIKTTNSAWAEGSYTLAYIGASSAFTLISGASFPFQVTGTYPNYNNATAGTLVESAVNRYLNLWMIFMPAAADSGSQAKRVLVLQPQVVHSTLVAAQAEAFTSLSLGNLATLATEWVPYVKITLRTDGAYGTTGKCRIEAVSYLTGTRSSVAAGPAALAAHAVTHKSGGTDQIKLDEFASPDDNTNTDVSTTAHGLAPKLPNDATKFFDGTGQYDTVKDTDLSTSDVTTNNVTSAKHGFAPKSPNDTTKFLRGDATPTWAEPPVSTPGGVAGSVQTNDGIGGFSGGADLKWLFDALSINGVVELFDRPDMDHAPGGRARLRYNASLRQLECSMDESEWMPFGPAASSSSSSSSQGSLTDARKYIEVIGNGVDSTIYVQHNLGTVDVLVQVRENASPFGYASPTVQVVDENIVRLIFGGAPDPGEYTAIVVG